MQLSDLIGPDCVLPSVKSAGKKQLFQEICAKAREVHGLEHRRVVEGLMEREKLGSTAMGNGIAIPHARIEDLDKIVGFFARLERPLDFEAADGLGVDLVFALLVPEGSGTDHLRALAKVSRLLRDSETCAKLRATADADALYALLTEQATSQAA
ncbi:MAG: PTS IIA-like nitrogen regulatory protein PtsN [Pseudomonadota bacterium]